MFLAIVQWQVLVWRVQRSREDYLICLMQIEICCLFGWFESHSTFPVELSIIHYLAKSELEIHTPALLNTKQQSSACYNVLDYTVQPEQSMFHEHVLLFPATGRILWMYTDRTSSLWEIWYALNVVSASGQPWAFCRKVWNQGYKFKSNVTQIESEYMEPNMLNRIWETALRFKGKSMVPLWNVTIVLEKCVSNFIFSTTTS